MMGQASRPQEISGNVQKSANYRKDPIHIGEKSENMNRLVASYFPFPCLIPLKPDALLIPSFDGIVDQVLRKNLRVVMKLLARRQEDIKQLKATTKSLKKEVS
jgi:hypothetical protein